MRPGVFSIPRSAGVFAPVTGWKAIGGDGFPENQVGTMVLSGFRTIDQHHADAPVSVHEARRRVHRETGAAHDPGESASGDGGNRAVHHRLIEIFFIEHHVGLDHAAAFAPGHAGGIRARPQRRRPCRSGCSGSDETLPWSSKTFLLPARVCSPSIFWVTMASNFPLFFPLGQLFMGRVGANIGRGNQLLSDKNRRRPPDAARRRNG